MTALPSWSWLGVGLVVAITAWYTEMPLFFWLGWAFIIVGVAKFVFGYVTRKDESPQERKAVQRMLPPSRMQHVAHQYYRCACGAAVRASDNFCTYCGRRLR